MRRFKHDPARRKKGRKKPTAKSAKRTRSARALRALRARQSSRASRAASKSRSAVVKPNQAYDQGFQEGYNQGIKQAEQTRDAAEQRKAYEKGMEDGIYTGGDGIIDSLLPGDVILPEISAFQVIHAGVEQMRPHFYPLLQPAVLGEELLQALEAKAPMSIVRLGDGELLTLAQEVVLSHEQVIKEGPFLGYAGVHVPDPEARDQLVHALVHANVVGIPKLRLRNFQPLAFSVLRAHGIDYKSLRLTDSLINYHLYSAGYLSKLLSGRRVLVVGNLAAPFADFLERNGVHVSGRVTPVHGVKDVPRVMESIRGSSDFDIALISAGISAVLIAQRVASEMGKVALDFGHLADSMLKGEAPFF